MSWLRDLDIIRHHDLERVHTHLIEMRITQSEYDVLLQQMVTLRKRYEALAIAKATSDQELSMFENNSVEVLAHVMRERSELQVEINLKMDNLRVSSARNNFLREQMLLKESDISQLKKDSVLLATTNRVLAESHTAKVTEKGKVMDSIHQLDKKKQDLVASNDHHKTVLENLSKEIEILTNYRRRLVEQINNYEAMNKSIESEIKSWVRREDISHQQVHKVKEQIAELQVLLHNKKSQMLTWRTRLQIRKQQYQKQIIKGRHLGKDINILTDQLKNKETQLGEVLKQSNVLDYNNKTTSQENQRLAELLNACNRHIHNLKGCTDELMTGIEQSLYQDVTVRGILFGKLQAYKQLQSKVTHTVPNETKHDQRPSAKLADSRSTQFTSSNSRIRQYT